MIIATTLVVTLNGTGAAAAVSNPITGKVKKIHFKKGTVDAATTAVVTITDTGEQLDSKDVNGGANLVTYPTTGLSGAAAGDNKWTEFIIDGTFTVTVTGGAASKSFTVILYVEN